jgi:hypothetical protein
MARDRDRTRDKGSRKSDRPVSAMLLSGAHSTEAGPKKLTCVCWIKRT